MPVEAQAAWRKANLPDQLLVSSRLSEIETYARACGIKLPTDDEEKIAADKS